MIRVGNCRFVAKYGCCTEDSNWGCDRTAANGNILNPVMSGKVTTDASIRYGRINVRARIPKGDWLWPGNYANLLFQLRIIYHKRACMLNKHLNSKNMLKIHLTLMGYIH